MKKLLFVFISLVFWGTLQAQNGTRTVNLEDIIEKGTFYAKTIRGGESMNDGLHYTTLEKEGTLIVKYSYQTGKAVDTLFNVKRTKPVLLESISGYELNPQESKILVYTNRKNIYRHSFTANYYVYEIEKRKIEPLSEKGAQQLATFSPDGKMVAFVRNNDLHIKKLWFKTESQVTNDGKFNEIINGAPDWVYEEEFGFNKAFAWSPDSRFLAFMRFDESKVKEFSFTMFQGAAPSHDKNELYPTDYSYKYPKAGEGNSKVGVHVFDVKHRTKKMMDLKLKADEDFYIPRIRWTATSEKLAIMKLNRHQNQMDLIFANPKSGVTETIFSDRNQYYISDGNWDYLTFLDDNKHFIYVGEMDGYNHIYLYRTDGRLVKQVTTGKWDVTSFLGYDAKRKVFYYESSEESPLRRSVYSINLKGSKKVNLTPESGNNHALFSKGFKYFINYFSNTTTPTKVTLHDSRGKLIRTLEENKKLKERLNEYAISSKEFYTFKTQEGTTLNGWMVKPLNFDPQKKYPVLMVQYSGPNSQQVRDRWSIGWEQYLAANGYIVSCVDGRGTGARGEAFRKATYMKLGRLESDDQISAANHLASLDYVDEGRIGIWGWSYGGFMTSLSMSRGNGIFKAGIAVAPVTHWKFYDSIYTERYMRTPEENQSGYDDNSPLNLADQLQGRLLLVHGSADDNVHFQNTMEYSERLVQAGKQFEMQVYTNRNHGIYGGKTRMHLYTRMCDFLFRNL